MMKPANVQQQQQQPLSCGMCQRSGSDLELVACGCTLHAMCVPVSFICSTTSIPTSSNNNKEQTILPRAVEPDSVPCPVCNVVPVHRMRLFPLALTDIDKAVDIRKKKLLSRKATGKRMAATTSTGDHVPVITSDAAFQAIQSESSYLLVSPSRSSLSSGTGLTTSSENDLKRTGRWTDAEIAFVDAVVEAFDHGQLVVPKGIKLNEFLCDLLLCKSSRLTKKMKNARLGVRSYEIKSSSSGSTDEDYRVMLSTLQDKFVRSICQDEAVQLELGFNLKRVWRTYFSNFCLQVGSRMLEANDWLTSLERMEARASQAEETIRRARRHRMGMALKTDALSAANTKGVFFAGIPAAEANKRLKKSTSKTMLANAGATSESYSTLPSVTDTSTIMDNDNEAGNTGDAEADLIAGMLDLDYNASSSNAADSAAHQMNVELSKLFEYDIPSLNHSFPSSDGHHHSLQTNCGPFLEELASYIELNDLPFEHVDVFVPSYASSETLMGTMNGVGTCTTAEQDLRLLHAGHATRGDVDPVLFCRLNEFGEYSVKFSFASGVGLPGRVFATGQPSWERKIDEADPKFFERAGGAKVYGVKTGVGFPLATSVIGQIVVSMYSIHDLEEDSKLVANIMKDLAKYSPEPKWKLVVDMGTSSEDEKTASGSPSGPVPHQGVVHYMHFDPLSGSVPQVCNPEPEPKSDGPGSAFKIEDSAFDPLEEEQQITTLLGDHMPIGGLPATGDASEAQLVPVYMSLRLLLLRAPEKRSAEETEVLEVVKKSYRGYAKDKRRSGKELAQLIVKDWQFLAMMTGDKKPAAKPTSSRSDAYVSHVMDTPACLNARVMTGAPVKKPSLSYVDPTMVRRASFSSSEKESKEDLGIIVPDDLSV